MRVGAIPPAEADKGVEPMGLMCAGCHSTWDDERLEAEKARNPVIISCCPERKMVPVYAAPSSVLAEVERLRADNDQLRAALIYAEATAETAEASLASMTAERDALAEAGRHALREMCNTIAPRNSFTDAVDALDAALARTARADRAEPARDIDRLPASELTDDELATAMERAEDRFEHRGEHGGSPGESDWERMDEIETEQKRRAARADRAGEAS